MRWSWLALAVGHVLSLECGYAIAEGYYGAALGMLPAVAVMTALSVSWALDAGARQERAKLTLSAKRARRKRQLLRWMRREHGQH